MRPSPTAHLNAQIHRRLAREARLRRVARALLATCGVAAVVVTAYGVTFIPAVERVTPKVLSLPGQGTTLDTFSGAFNDPVALEKAAHQACVVPRYRRAFSEPPASAWIRWRGLGSSSTRSRVDCRTYRVG